MSKAASSGEMVHVKGRLGGFQVEATWVNRTVTGDALLIVAARLVIAGRVTAYDENVETRASFATLGGAVIALCRALDGIDVVTVTHGPPEVAGDLGATRRCRRPGPAARGPFVASIGPAGSSGAAVWS
jgi:hypothetical protein